MSELRILPAYERLPEIKALLQEYVETEYTRMLGVDLAFQHIQEELENPQVVYPQPGSGLYLIYWQDELAGCVAFRRLSDAACEIKRLYVRKACRGHNLGEKALLFVLSAAEQQGYRTAYCDTLASKTTAVNLYKRLGFTECEAYYPNPLADVLYLKKNLLAAKV